MCTGSLHCPPFPDPHILPRMQWVTSALQKPPHFHGHILVAAVILTLQIQQLQSGLCYERETCNIKIAQEQVRHQEGILVDDTVTGFSLYILLLCCPLFHKISALLFWTSPFLFIAGEGHKHGRKLDQKQDWSHQKLPQKPYCLWLQARITENISGSPNAGSPPSHRPRCTPYGSFLTSKDRKKWSPSLRLNPLVPLKCGRVYDVSITSSAIPFFLHTKPEQCLTTLATTRVGG